MDVLLLTDSNGLTSSLPRVFTVAMDELKIHNEFGFVLVLLLSTKEAAFCFFSSKVVFSLLSAVRPILSNIFSTLYISITKMTFHVFSFNFA